MPSPSLATEVETSYVSDAKPISEDELSIENNIENKFEPELWEKVQTSLSNGTMKDLSLIIRLVRDKRITGMEIEELKNHAVSLFTNNSNATVYSVCDVLPVIMATVSVTEAEKIATYEFVESIGDGDKTGYAGLDISRSAIGADDVETTFGYDGTGITIAILDSGIHHNHPDLNDLDDNPGTTDPKVIDNISFVDWDDNGIPDVGPEDNVGHGTHVAGIAAGTGEQSGGLYRGIAPGAWLMNVKVCNLSWLWGEPVAEFEHDDVINGINYAVAQGADVISMSLMSYPGGDGTSELAKAADDAVDQGVHVVTIAGNYADLQKAITTPGDAFNVITVGAVDDHNTEDNIQDDTLAWFSSRGPTHEDISKARPKPDVVAPGVDIIAPVDQGSEYWQTYPDDRVGDFYLRSGGTSTAAPHVSGTVALMLEANPNLTPAQVKAILRQTARLNGNLTGYTVNDRGHGIIDAFAAVQMAQGGPSSIVLSQMYDGFEVETPRITYGVGQAWGTLEFTVGEPSTFGISVIDVDYHKYDLWGAIHFYYSLLWRLTARHVWIDGIYYDLALDMDEYLFSGPRITTVGSGYVYIRAIYRVNNVFVEYLWKLHVDDMFLWLFYRGGSSYKTLIYIDTCVRDEYNYAYLPLTSEHIYYERKVTGDTLLDMGDLDYSEYIEIEPFSIDDPIMWVLRYGYIGNNPDSVLDGEYICNQDMVVYYQGTSSNPGPWISRETTGLPKPRPTLTVVADYGGTISPSPGSYQYDLGTESHTFTASPNTDYNFDGWTLDGVTYDTSISTSVPMNAPHILKAWFSYKYTSCVAEGTLVTMADGSTKPVEEIKKGDQVLGYDPTTGSYIAENVLDTLKHQVEVIVNINNGMLKLTPLDQPIFIRNSTYEGWVRDPANIQVGWEIYNATSNGWVPVSSVTFEEGKTRVYDLVLDGYTTYIANGILLMDKC